ncbi:hypothetical protein COCON_G00093490 [Conger conger]|uniref:Uncharacterized protein n=1 Tax=Conger conger TaxID=82655 RepID=A0A9Q1DLU1_CONCO|nr:hypothetical protein COCON_G00093490 [Conger conger]
MKTQGRRGCGLLHTPFPRGRLQHAHLTTPLSLLQLCSSRTIHRRRPTCQAMATDQWEALEPCVAWLLPKGVLCVAWLPCASGGSRSTLRCCHGGAPIYDPDFLEKPHRAVI